MSTYVTGRGGANAVCDVCGFQYKNFELQRRWDNLMVCKDDWETRHPQEFIRAVRDNFPLPFVRRNSVEAEAGALAQSYMPTSVLLYSAMGTYGNRMTFGATKYITGMRFMIGNLRDSAYPTTPQEVLVGVWEHAGSTLVKSATVLAETGRWIYVPFTPYYSAAAATFSASLFIPGSNNLTLAYKTPRPTISNLGNSITFNGCYYTNDPSFSIPVGSDQTSDLYMLDLLTIPRT